MLPALQHLLVLQDRDRRIASLRQEIARIPREIAAVQKRLQDEVARVEAFRQQLKQVEVQRKKLEVEAESKRAELAKFRVQLNQIKSNVEYQAMLKQIAGTEQEIVQLEDHELELMDQIERMQPQLKEQQAQLQEFTVKCHTQEAELRGRVEMAERELVRLQQERQELAAVADADLLGRYERLLKSKGDCAIVPIVRGSCGGCHLNLPAHVIHNARNGSEVVSCDHCGRILYWQAG
ncbi:MAG: C4-type zinc ribbon domain-containing protein [Verrucomicrobiae bacterium]|nr:C4-type zinc ribbon domain-containing protein [Verrucomicrobiae bacterium]